MQLVLNNVLDAPTLTAIRNTLSSSNFADGNSTAGWHARTVKNNLQTTHEGCAQRVHQALFRHKLFRTATQPNVLMPPTFSRYVPGMSYGSHVDDAIMGATQAVRTDIAMTVFLSDPASYDGGELVIESYTGETRFKLAAGDAILYPATTIHHVAEVTRGERLAAVMWIQSLVRDPARREILFDLDSVRRALWEKAGRTKTPEFDLAAKTYVNLMRLWAEP
ncbi:MAG: Fe2+-dependent dioxygenase [Panacagrimonas sp.]